jgi:hypothetical protein
MNTILGEHDHIIAWEEDPNLITRVLVKARVVNLEEIPWFIVSTEGPGFNGDSWTIQVEIIQARMLGGLGPDEDIPPGPDDLQPHFFDIFGFGQPGHGLAFQLQPQQQQPRQPEQQQPGPAHDIQGEGWGLWPQGQDEQAQQDAVIVQAIPAAQLLNFDLNQPLEQVDDDLGVVENFPGPLQPPQQPAEPMDEDIIVASSDSEGGAEQQMAPEQQMAAEQQEVNVFIPMENGAPLQLIPDEIHENELMDAPDFNAADVDQMENNFDQLGFVELFQPAQDPVFVQRLISANFQGSPAIKSNPEAIRLWANFLALVAGAPSVQIPKVWADFFTMMLLSPRSFQWAKQFVTSSAMEHLARTSSSSVPFCLPQTIPDVGSFLCSNNLPAAEEPDASLSSHETTSPVNSDQLSPATPPEKLKSKVAPVTGPWSTALLDLAAQNEDSSVLKDAKTRRSLRQKALHKGYKNSPCSNKNCLGCSLNPPTLSPSVIKNLGATFCNINPDKLAVEKLSKARIKKAAAPGGKKQAKSKSKINLDSTNDDSQAASKKKPKKN